MDGWEETRPTSDTKLTAEEFLELPGFEIDGLRHELIDGVHFVTPSPATVHQQLVGELYVALHDHLKRTGQGEVFLAPLDVVLSNHDVVEPDLLVVLTVQSDIVTDKHVRGTPAIVIEVLSPGTRKRDETLKRDLYERVGVREYWMVDPDSETMTVLAADAGTPPPEGQASQHTPLRPSAASNDALTSRRLPGFELELQALFDRT